MHCQKYCGCFRSWICCIFSYFGCHNTWESFSVLISYSERYSPYRFAFSRALKNVLATIVSGPSSCDFWIRLLILPLYTLREYIPRERQQKISKNRKALAIFSDLGGPLNLLNTLFKKTSQTSVLLEENHPYASAHMHLLWHCLPLQVLKTILWLIMKLFFAVLNFFHKGLLEDKLVLELNIYMNFLFYGFESVMASDLIVILTPIINLWLNDKCHAFLAEFLTSSPLTPLLKPDGRVRTITIDTI